MERQISLLECKVTGLSLAEGVFTLLKFNLFMCLFVFVVYKSCKLWQILHDQALKFVAEFSLLFDFGTLLFRNIAKRGVIFKKNFWRPFYHIELVVFTLRSLRPESTLSTLISSSLELCVETIVAMVVAAVRHFRLFPLVLSESTFLKFAFLKCC